MTTAGFAGRDRAAARGAAALVGLAAGALIGLLTCAPAAAKPSDTSPRDNRSESAPDHASPSAARRVAGSKAKPATAPRPRSAIRAARPAGAAVPRLGDSRGRRLTILKGTHLAIPTVSRLWLTETSGDATFTSDSAYDLQDADQYDWNKLAGITFTPWRPERNAAMVVWRYNLDTREYEVGPFFDNDFAYVFPSDAEVISVPVDQTFRWTVDYTGITVTYGDTTVVKPYPPGLTPKFWTSAKVTGWFGGSERAPRTLSYYVHMR